MRCVWVAALPGVVLRDMAVTVPYDNTQALKPGCSTLVGAHLPRTTLQEGACRTMWMLLCHTCRNKRQLKTRACLSNLAERLCQITTPEAGPGCVTMHVQIQTQYNQIKTPPTGSSGMRSPDSKHSSGARCGRLTRQHQNVVTNCMHHAALSAVVVSWQSMGFR